jgi:hypothetical protein
MECSIPDRPKSRLPVLTNILNTWPISMMSQWLENYTKDKAIPSQNIPVVTATELSGELLRQLFEDEIMAIHIPQYCPSNICEAMAKELKNFKTSNWKISDAAKGYKITDVQVFGNPFNIAIESDEAWKTYFSKGLDVTRQIRGSAGQRLSPQDRLRLELDEIYPHGFKVKRHHGQFMSPGLVRVMNGDPDKQCEDMPLNCHVDTTPLISKNAGVFATNIYLQPAPKGGDIVIWDPDITTLFKLFANWSACKNFFLSSNLLDREIQSAFQKLLPTCQKINIKQGDLILLNTSRPHATTMMTGGQRISIQSFLKYKKGKPLEMWA